MRAAKTVQILEYICMFDFIFTERIHRFHKAPKHPLSLPSRKRLGPVG